MEGFLIRGWEFVPPGCAGSLRSPANQRSARGTEVSTLYRAFLTRGIIVFIPALSELWMYGEIAEPGMGTYPPRARQVRGVSPRGSSRRARLAS